MADYTRLPGVYVKINDAGLRVTPPVSLSPRVLIIGTAGKGPAYVPIEVNSVASIKSMFGSNGTLMYKLMEAVGGGADNVTLFRIGSTPTVVTGLGYVSAESPGATLTFEDHSPTIDNDYYICYKNGELGVYSVRGTTLYSNNADDPLDLGVIRIDGDFPTTVTSGSFIGTAYDNAVSFENAVLVGDIVWPASTAIAAGDSGLSISKRRLYECANTAFALLDGYDSDIVMIANAIADEYNVAYFETSLSGSITANHDPRGNSDVLGWLRIRENGDSEELFDYFWSEEVTPNPSAITVNTVTDSYLDLYKVDPVANPINFSSAVDRVAKEFHEVNFPFLLANYCYQTTKNNNEMFGVMAMRGPRSAKLYDINRWVGQSPVFNYAGTLVSDGSGLLGFPLTMGCSASRLNNLVYGQSSGRGPGLFATAEDTFDGTVIYDDNHQRIDLGAYINFTGEYPIVMTTNFPYAGPIDALYCGLISSLDPKDGTTFNSLPSVKPRYKLSKSKLDELCGAKIVMMDALPVKGYAIVDGMTGATDSSDFRRLTTVRILHMVSQRVRAATIPFIGKAALTDLKKLAIGTALDAVYSELAKRGYLADYSFRIDISKYDQVMGNVKIFHTFIPALETRRITHTYQFKI